MLRDIFSLYRIYIKRYGRKEGNSRRSDLDISWDQETDYGIPPGDRNPSKERLVTINLYPFAESQNIIRTYFLLGMVCNT